MIIIISPSKTLDFNPLDYTPLLSKSTRPTKPRVLKDSQILIDGLKQLDPTAIQNLMKVSEKIAVLNAERFNNFEVPFNKKNSKPAGFAFKGDVYRGLDFETLSQEHIDFAQNHLRVLSGLYGLLRPLDFIQPYRLEMGTRYQNEKGKNLYEFWDNKITDLLNKDLETTASEALINLASGEYFKAIKLKNLSKPLLNIHFKELRDDKYKIISFSAKYARGLMSRYIIENKITKIADLKKFKLDGYKWNTDLSDDKDWVFTRPKP